MWSATGQIAVKIPSTQNQRRSSYGSQRSGRRSTVSSGMGSISRQTTTNSIQGGQSVSRHSTTPSAQSPGILVPQSSTPKRGASAQANRESSSTFDSAPFVTPSGSPLPVLGREMSEEPGESEDLRRTKGKGRQERDDIAGDEDVMPAIAMMSSQEFGQPLYATSTRSSGTVKHEMGNKDADESENTINATGPQAKRRSKKLDKIFGSDAPSAQSVTVAGTDNKRETRDFADMMMSGDDRLAALFDREDMSSQSFVRKPNSGQSPQVPPAAQPQARIAPQPSMRAVNSRCGR